MTGLPTALLRAYGLIFLKQFAETPRRVFLCGRILLCSWCASYDLRNQQAVFSGSWATAKRYCDMMCDVGALEYTDSGMVVVTEKGNQTSDWYFQRLFEMAEQVSQVDKSLC